VVFLRRIAAFLGGGRLGQPKAGERRNDLQESWVVYHFGRHQFEIDAMPWLPYIGVENL